MKYYGLGIKMNIKFFWFLEIQFKEELRFYLSSYIKQSFGLGSLQFFYWRKQLFCLVNGGDFLLWIIEIICILVDVQENKYIVESKQN